MDNDKKIKNFIKTTFVEFIDENNNYVPKQQPYDGFTSHPKAPTKLEKTTPFSSTNIVGGGDNEMYCIRYYANFTDDMVCELVYKLTDMTNCVITTKSGSMIKPIKVDAIIIGYVEYERTVCIYTKYIKNFKISMMEIFPNEYKEYIDKYS